MNCKQIYDYNMYLFYYVYIYYADICIYLIIYAYDFNSLTDPFVIY